MEKRRIQDHNFLMGTLYARYKSLHTYEEMIFLFKSAKYFRDKKINAEYVFELRLFMQYLRSKNFVFKDILQSVPIYGLEYFQMHYSTMRVTNGQYVWKNMKSVKFYCIPFTRMYF